MQHRAFAAVLGQGFDRDRGGYAHPVAQLEVLCVGIAAQEAEERDVIRAADHAEPAGDKRSGRHIAADIHLRAEADGLAVVLAGIAGGVDIPQAVILIPDIDDIRVEIERQGHVAGVVLAVSVHVVQIDGRTRVHGADVLLIEHLLERIGAAVEHH